MNAEGRFPVRVPPFRGVIPFFWTELRVQLHESTAIYTSMIIQVVLLVFVRILDPALLGVALVGALIFSVFALGQRVQNEAAFVRIDHKLNELYLASPLSPEGYFLGMALGVLVAYLGPIAVLAGVAEWVLRLGALSWGTLLLVAGAVWVFSSSIGYIVSTLFKDMRTIWPYASLFYNLFGVLPPVFYPLAFFPVALRPVALMMPPSAAAALVQTTIDPGWLTTDQVVLAAVALGLEAALVFLFAVYWARRTVRES
jgi:ABC-2 type transport system permease protein